MPNQRKLKNYLINPKFQLRYIGWLFLTGLILILWNFSVFYFYTRENYALLVELSPMTEEARLQLQRELSQISALLALSSLAFLAVMVVVGVAISHRAAGPLFQFKRVFSEIRDGKRQARIKLRTGDDFQEIARAFNEMMDEIAPKK